MIIFEWDDVKAASNRRKHGVSFEEAITVFGDEHALQFWDEEHSQLQEDRFLLLGLSDQARLLLVCHCEAQGEDTIRVISAREATRRESAYYDENT